MHFVMELAKILQDHQRVFIHYKRVYMMLGTKEKDVTRVTLEFLNDIIPVFEVFVAISKESSGYSCGL